MEQNHECNFIGENVSRENIEKMIGQLYSLKDRRIEGSNEETYVDYIKKVNVITDFFEDVMNIIYLNCYNKEDDPENAEYGKITRITTHYNEPLKIKSKNESQDSEYFEFTKEDNCYTCKNGYFMDFSFDGHHNLCGGGECYLCREQYGSCKSYERGDVPEGKERDIE